MIQVREPKRTDRPPGLSPAVAVLGLATYGLAVGFASHAAADAWGLLPGLFVLAPGSAFGLLCIVSGSRGLHG